VAAAVMGTTQPATIAAIMTPELKAARLLARLLAVYPSPRKRQWTEAEIPDLVRERFTALLKTLFALEPGRWENGKPRPHLLRLAPAAKARFISFYNANGEEIYTADHDKSASTSKLEGYALRFALIFHCCRYPDSPANHLVADEEMGKAIALTGWFRDEADRVYQMLA
jgi:hypothetical protein